MNCVYDRFHRLGLCLVIECFFQICSVCIYRMNFTHLSASSFRMGFVRHSSCYNVRKEHYMGLTISVCVSDSLSCTFSRCQTTHMTRGLCCTTMDTSSIVGKHCCTTVQTSAIIGIRRCTTITLSHVSAALT
jgi:hypothetical protein